jgi:hypothetical protein
MRHRTQLHLDDDQYRWLRRRAREHGSIAAVVRQLIDDARRLQEPLRHDDPLIRFLADDEPAQAGQASSVADLDRALYGA